MPKDELEFRAEMLDTPELQYMSSSADGSVRVELPPKELFEAQAASEERFVLVNFDFPTWNPDSLHWEAPSNMTFYSDGRVYLYAKRIANHRRHGPFNQGRTYTWRADYQYHDQNGTVMQSSSLKLATLRFNQTKDDADAEKTDDFLRDNWRRIHSVTVTRRIHR